MELEELKVKYEDFEKKYKHLPSFKEINEDFDIDRLDRDSFCFLRLIRKTMLDKIGYYLSFFEFLSNPVNAPRLYMSRVKSLNTDDKKLVEELYERMGKLTISALNLEINYSEKAEADLIRQIFDVWNNSKKDLKKISEKLNLEVNEEGKKARSYFG